MSPRRRRCLLVRLVSPKVRQASGACRSTRTGRVRPAAGQFRPAASYRRAGDLTRYRKKLVEDRAKEVQRVQKTLEDAGIKLESVVTDVMGKAARRMIEALIAGERDPEVLADMALTRMRPRIPDLRLALVGRFDAHHATMLNAHLSHIDYLDGQIAAMDTEVERVIDPFADQLRRLTTIPGVGRRTAEVVIAEIGVDMARFPTSGHLASWAGLCPGHHESAGKSRERAARKGNSALRVALCEAAWAGVRKNDSYLGAQFRRFQRRFGKKAEGKAIFACAHSLIVMIWHVLAETTPCTRTLEPTGSPAATTPPPTPAAWSANSRTSATT